MDDDDEFEIEIVGDSDLEYLEMPEPPHPQKSSNGVVIIGDADRDCQEMPDLQPKNDFDDTEIVGAANLDYLEAPEIQPQKSSNDSDISRDTSSAISEMSKDKIKLKSEETDTNYVVPFERIPESVSDDSSAVNIEIMLINCDENPVAFVKRTRASYTDNSSVLFTTRTPESNPYQNSLVPMGKNEEYDNYANSGIVIKSTVGSYGKKDS